MIINWLWYPFFFFFQNMRKMQFFNENMLGKFLGFGRMHENKIYIFFVFEKWNWFKSFWDLFLRFFEIVFLNISEKTTYFNIGLVFYSVNIQPDIMQNE